MSESRRRAELRQKLDAILELARMGRLSSNEAAKQMVAIGASMSVIGRLLQGLTVKAERPRSRDGDGWFG